MVRRIFAVLFLFALFAFALPAMASDTSSDILGGLVSTDTAVKVGAGYSAIQALAYFLSMVVPAHTIVGRLVRAVVKWPAQLLPKSSPTLER